MIDILMGAASACMCVGSFCLGYMLGHPRAVESPERKSPSQGETPERDEDILAAQAAFGELLSYSADTAYGRGGAER